MVCVVGVILFKSVNIGYIFIRGEVGRGEVRQAVGSEYGMGIY